jgi:hypothetical protein
MDKAEFEKYYPGFQSAILTSVEPLTRTDIRHKAMAAARKRSFLDPVHPNDPNAIDLLELRGSLLNADRKGQVTVPLYINFSYRNDEEIFQDFALGDVVTILFEMNRNTSQKNVAHPEYIYNHETRIMVKCFSDFSMYKAERIVGGMDVLLEDQKLVERARDAIIFLHEYKDGNIYIPEQGNQPRPYCQELVYYQFQKPKKFGIF